MTEEAKQLARIARAIEVAVVGALVMAGAIMVTFVRYAADAVDIAHKAVLLLGGGR